MNTQPTAYTENLQPESNSAAVLQLQTDQSLQGQGQPGQAYVGQGQSYIGQAPSYAAQGQIPIYPGQGQIYQVQGQLPAYQDPNSYPVGGAPQIVYAFEPTTVVYENYKSRQSKITGILQILIGIALIAFNATLIALKPNGLGPVSHGFWGGIACIITGGFGCSAARYRTKFRPNYALWRRIHTVITYMVTCIITAALMIALISVAGVGIALRVEDCLNYYWPRGYSYYCNGRPEGVISMHVVMLFLGLCEGCVAIWGSTLLCRTAGCCATSNSTVSSQAVQFIPGNGQRIIIIGHPSQANAYPGYMMNPGSVEMAQPYTSTEDISVHNGAQNLEKQRLTED